jgi:hypothetical protein
MKTNADVNVYTKYSGTHFVDEVKSSPRGDVS